MAKNLSTFAIAQMLHVDPGSVANWIDQDLLKAHRTPGGHRRVAVADLIVFLKVHKMPIPPEVETAPTRIMVIDDEVAITQLIAKAIKAAHPDFEVLQANDGFQAGRLLTTEKPDVVLLDLRMPGMDGYEVCRMIKNDSTTRHAEVLAVTAHASEENVTHILECGARVCLTKPVDMDTLMQEIDRSL